MKKKTHTKQHTTTKLSGNKPLLRHKSYSTDLHQSFLFILLLFYKLLNIYSEFNTFCNTDNAF